MKINITIIIYDFYVHCSFLAGVCIIYGMYRLTNSMCTCVHVMYRTYLYNIHVHLLSVVEYKIEDFSSFLAPKIDDEETNNIHGYCF